MPLNFSDVFDASNGDNCCIKGARGGIICLSEALRDLQMKRWAAVIGTKRKELPILITEPVPQEGLDVCLGARVLVTRNRGPPFPPRAPLVFSVMHM